MSCEKAPPTDSNTNTQNIPQLTGSKVINRSWMVSVGKHTQKPTDQTASPLLTLRRALLYNEHPFLNQDSLQKKMSKQKRENLCLNEQDQLLTQN